MKISRRMVRALFFLSGATGLIYETLWAKYLALSLGHTARAYALVMAAFLGGLALGNALLGPVADRSRNRIRFYARLELGIGLLALLAPVLLEAASNAYIAAARSGGLPAALLVALRLSLAALVLLPPTILMGGTFPALCRWMTGSLDEMEASVSGLYFINSAGAVAGALLVGFWMIPALGLDLASAFAAAVNLSIGAFCLRLAREIPDEAPARSPRRDAGGADARARLIYGAVFVSGFVSLCYEIAWTRLLALVLGSSAYSFTVMLAAFIGGIALGSLIVARWKAPSKDPAELFGLAELGVALALAATLPLYPRLPYLFLRLQSWFAPAAGNFYLFIGAEFLGCVLLTVVPAALIGATLPLATRAVTRRVERVGAGVGAVFAYNTAGNVLGALAAGLWLLPRFGIKPLIGVGVALNWATGATALIFLARRPAGWKAKFILGALMPAAAYWVLGGAWDERALASGPYRLGAALSRSVRSAEEFRRMLDQDEVIFYREDADVSVAVTRRRGGELSLRLNGKADASTGGDMASQALLGHLPLLLRPRAKRVFMIGMGSGVSAGAVLRHPVERLDLAEIAPGVVDAARLFGDFNHRAVDDPRLKLFLDDAKTVLRTSSVRYDVVISEPSNPWIAGIGNLFSVEFYREAKAHLADDGVMAQWFHTYSMSDELLLSVLRTYRSVFPYVTVWNTLPSDVILIGSNSPLTLDGESMRARFEDPDVRGDLGRVGIGRLTTVLSLQAASDAQVRRILDGSPFPDVLNRDRFPSLEYEAPKAFYLSSEATALAARDQRLEGDPGRELLWSRYLAGRSPSREEFADLAAFHGRFPSALSDAVDAERARRFPGDVAVRRVPAKAPPRATGRAEAGARELVEDVDLELTRYYASRSFLNPGDPSAAIAAVRRLEKSGLVGPGVLGQKWAGVYAASDPRRALASLEAVGKIAENNGARGGANVLLEAARTAIRLDDDAAARADARRAVKLDPSNAGARIVSNRLEALKPGP